ncbi:MAG: GNAT family N-acetyltransferase [Cyclobacteriaceae bacterium]|nr:GNAT family N-acetyltransferase [Cyclobacteriaceae bacterium]
MKIDIELYEKKTRDKFTEEEIANFLYTHLDKYGDGKNDILKAIKYALGEENKPGGFIVLAVHEERIIGAVIINNTEMSGYIPEHILVYIAVNKDYRGEGIGKKLMRKTIDACEGDIALHVEKDNPARHLYEKLGFTNPYLEMRLKQP